MSETDERLRNSIIDEVNHIYAKAVGVDKDSLGELEAITHLENVIFNARIDARAAEFMQEKAERERDEARAQRDSARSKADEERREAEKWHHKATVLAADLDEAREQADTFWKAYVDLNNGEFAQACEDRDQAREQVEALLAALDNRRTQVQTLRAALEETVKRVEHYTHAAYPDDFRLGTQHSEGLESMTTPAREALAATKENE